MVRLPVVWILAALGASACQTAPPRAAEAPRASVSLEETEPWRGVASAKDAAALDGLPAQWDRALAASRSGGFARRVSAEASLLVRGASLARGAPPPGSYRCRFVRLGTRRWTASGQGFCYVTVEAGQLSLATELRGLRVGGYLWEPKGGERLVFLGAAVPAGGKSAPAYDEVGAATTAGLVDRIGEFRYRLALPEASSGAGVTIVDMIAAPRP